MSKNIAFEINPCPFCNGLEVAIQRFDEPIQRFAVVCDNVECCAEGPLSLTKKGAVDLWNSRVTENKLSQQVELADDVCKALEIFINFYTSYDDLLGERFGMSNLLIALSAWNHIKKQQQENHRSFQYH